MNSVTLFVKSNGSKKVLTMNSIGSSDPPRPDGLGVNSGGY